MEEWRTIRLEEGLERLIDYRGKSPTKSETGIPVISAKVVKSGRIIKPIEQTITPEYYKKWMVRGIPQVGDIVLTTEGPMGEVAQLDSETASFALGQRVVCLSGKSNTLDNDFLKFLLMSPTMQQRLLTYATGTTVAGISQKSLRSVPLTIPSLSEQRAIASVLGALDDKIELNRRMNETLEAMARAIFRDWFVDFGPTRAKMEGRAPYLAPEIWSLFPDRLDADGKPEGWRIGHASDIIEFNPSETLKKGEIAPYIDMAALPTMGSVAQPPVFREFGSGTKFRDGDTLFARITPCLENGKTAFVQQLGEGTVGWGSTEFIVMRSKEPVPAAVSYVLARDDNFRTYAMQSMTGTSGRQRARTDAMKSYPVTLPADDALWIKLSEFFASLFERIAVNADETPTLADTRDALLPKLMSGEIRISDAEQIVEEVA